MRRKFKILIFRIKVILIILMVLFIIFLGVFTIQFEKHFMPAALSITEKHINEKINKAINESIQQVIKNMGLETSDFFESEVSGGNIKYLNINNILINEVCTKISNILSTNLNNLENSKIPLQLGGLTGLNYLSNLGPNINITISFIGNSTIDYETKFEAVGINQINFQVWLDITTNVNIVSPLISEKINVTRKMALVNTVFNGEIPKTYFNNQTN